MFYLKWLTKERVNLILNIRPQVFFIDHQVLFHFYSFVLSRLLLLRTRGISWILRASDDVTGISIDLSIEFTIGDATGRVIGKELAVSVQFACSLTSVWVQTIKVLNHIALILTIALVEFLLKIEKIIKHLSSSWKYDR